MIKLSSDKLKEGEMLPVKDEPAEVTRVEMLLDNTM